MIDAAEALDAAVGAIAREIAGAIAVPRSAAPRSPARAEQCSATKRLAGQLGPVPVAARHAVAADQQFARRADRLPAAPA